MGPEVRVLVQHLSRFPSGTPCDTDHFFLFREAGAYFDFYEASPVKCTVACITGWACHRSIGIRMCVLCSLDSSKVGSMGPLPASWGTIGLCTGFVGYGLEIACAFAGAANPECSGS
eukprot:27775-Pelagomonas_calceolata.AAC.1